MDGLGEPAAVGGGRAEEALETGAEIMLVGAPWGARQGQNRPCPDKASANQEKRPRDFPKKVAAAHVLST